MNNKCSTCVHCGVCDPAIIEMNKSFTCRDWNGFIDIKDDKPEEGLYVLAMLTDEVSIRNYNDLIVAMRNKEGVWVRNLSFDVIPEEHIKGWMYLPGTKEL